MGIVIKPIIEMWNLKSLFKNEISPSFKHTKIAIKSIKIFKKTAKNIGVSGFDTPDRKQNSLIKSPTITKNPMFNPIENRMVSNMLSSFNFNNFRRISPGTNVK